MNTLTLNALAPSYALRGVPATAPQVAATAQLLHALTNALMQSVHEAATLNVATVRMLLAPSNGSLGGELQRISDSWRFSWRSFEICAKTAASVLDLAETQARSGFETLWKSFESNVEGRAAFDDDRTDALRDALAELKVVQIRYFEAAIEAHRRLITLVAGARQEI